MPSMDGQFILVSTFGGRSGQATLSSQLLREACGLSVADRQRPLVPVPWARGWHDWDPTSA
jgi:hypothetical protein